MEATVNRWQYWTTGVLLILASTAAMGAPASCEALQVPGGGRGVQAFRLGDGSIIASSGMNINIDGYARAYHRRNRDAGAVLHLCVGGRVRLPDGSSYEGSESSATCTGKFMADLARIEAAGWTDPTIGVVEWYGIVADGSVKMAGRTVKGVRPVLQKDGSGFYVSPTALVDADISDPTDQRRYVNPLRVPAAVAPGSLAGVVVGSYGVVIHKKKLIAVPFVVGDRGPRIGEGSPVLARAAAGLTPSDNIDLKNRYDGQVDGPQLLWVFFGGPADPFHHDQELQVAGRAKSAFEKWGGDARLAACRTALAGEP